ncbi:uncharacterized protein LOC143121767 [Alosa pseudoharengus]|uniref:uncharacterized protein LOC143121767 n=1 Tax=Alosa pseudoharengus TaxID=34774 RepID=UPI003F890F76
MATTPICAQLLGLSAAILSLLRPYGCEVVTRYAEVGGRVSMDCEIDHHYRYLYWQKKTEPSATFVNGLTTANELTILPEYSNRSKVHENNGTLELWDLKLSDTMHYTCEKVSKDGDSSTLCTYHLTVTAEYTQPVLTTHSSDDGHLNVTCSSWGGSPRDDVQWQVFGEPNSTGLWNPMSAALQDTTDLYWNVTSTLTLICTQKLRISCAIGNVTSEELEICTQLFPFPLNVIIAIGVVAFLALGMLLCGIAQLLKRFCRDSNGQRARVEEMPLQTTPDPASSEETSFSSHVEGPREPV